MAAVGIRRTVTLTEIMVHGEPSSRPSLVRRACDQCHGRKVKCDGKLPCRTCNRHGELCTFLKPVRRKGPPPKNRNADGSRRDPPRFDTAPDLRQDRPHVSSPSQNRTLDVFGDNTEPSPKRVRFEAVPPPDLPVLDAFPDVASESTSAYWLDSLESANSGRLVEWPDGLELESEEFPVCPSFGLPVDSSSEFDFAFDPSAFDTSDVIPYFKPQSPRIDMSFNPFASQAFSPRAWTVPSTNEQISPLFSNVLESMIKPQLEVFFIRVYPMIPIFTRQEIMSNMQDPRQMRRPGFVALVLSMAALSLVHPLEASEMVYKPIRGQQATILMDEACRLVASWDHGCDPSVESILISYLMFGTLFELGHAAGARLRLKEAVTMGEAMHLDLGWGYQSCGPEESARRTRLFWVLAITERAYALQREGSIIFGGSIARPTTSTPTDSSGQLLHYLAIIFSHIDQDVVSCWNGRCGGRNCQNLTRQRAVKILRELKGTAKRVFGDALLPDLNETQKADLLITWQWIRNRIWRLAALHGLTTEDDAPELSVEYLLDVARTTLLICERLSSSSMEAHGVGFVEKLYDIASTVMEQIQSHHNLRVKVRALIKDATCMDTLGQLSAFVSRHPSGLNISTTMAQEMAQARDTTRLICI